MVFPSLPLLWFAISPFYSIGLWIPLIKTCQPPGGNWRSLTVTVDLQITKVSSPDKMTVLGEGFYGNISCWDPSTPQTLISPGCTLLQISRDFPSQSWQPYMVWLFVVSTTSECREENHRLNANYLSVNGKLLPNHQSCKRLLLHCRKRPWGKWWKPLCLTHSEADWTTHSRLILSLAKSNPVLAGRQKRLSNGSLPCLISVKVCYYASCFRACPGHKFPSSTSEWKSWRQPSQRLEF